jgi:2-keto-4-pentenoate hydratase
MTPAQLLQHHDEASLWPGASGLDVPAAYQCALALRSLRMKRGERPLGYKVGFTNRNIWPRYGAQAPMWGTVYDTTTSFCEGQGTVSLAGICQPRLEPECVVGMAATPPADASLDALLACVDWVAPGFEIVQSHQDWKFSAGDSVADGGLHARLLVGPRVPARVIGRDVRSFEQQLARARVVLCKGVEQKDEGTGANVLEGPLHALLHFVRELRQCPGAPQLLPGDLVTTGTWTDAWPVAPGEQWSARFDAPLSPLAIRFG